MEQWCETLGLVRCGCAEAESFDLDDAAEQRLSYLKDFVLGDQQKWIKQVGSTGAPDYFDEAGQAVHVVDFADSREVLDWIVHGSEASFWELRGPDGRHGDSQTAGWSYDDDQAKVDLEEIFDDRQFFMKQSKEQERLRQQNPLSPGRWVKLTGMQTTHLNGCIGEIIQEVNSACRIGVRVQGQGSTGKLIREQNLELFSDADTVKVARLFAKGEQTGDTGQGSVRTWRWPRCVLSELKSEVSPVSRLIDIPLCVARVQAHKLIDNQADSDNQWATNFMIEPLSGIAPSHWQSQVGPVVIWRSDLEPFSADDARLVHSFISDLLERYPCDDPLTYITPSIFQRAKQWELENSDLDEELLEHLEDINI